MEDLLNNIAKNLQESVAAAADKAGELTRIARARLDIASTKKRIYRTQAALGTLVHQKIVEGETPDCDEVRERSNALRALESELMEREEFLLELQREQSRREELDPPQDEEDI